MSDEKNNLLIITGDSSKPYEDWKSEVDRLTPKGEFKKGFDPEKGFEDDLKYAEKPVEQERTVRPRSLPPEFCPYCDKHTVGLSIQKSKVLHVFTHPFPGLDIKVGDAIEYYVENRCARRYVEGDDDEMDLDDAEAKAIIAAQDPNSTIDLENAPQFRANRKRAKALEIEERVVAYIQSQYVKGIRDTAIFGEDSRRERFADKDEKE